MDAGVMEDGRKPKEMPVQRAEPAPASSTPPAALPPGSPGTPTPKPKNDNDPWGEEWFPAHRRKRPKKGIF
jgi:hypothetical protein